MRQLTFIGILILITNILVAQENIKGDIIIGIAVGPSFSNLWNSEAPHKINYFGSDVHPAIFDSFDSMEAYGFGHYETSVFKDVLYGVSAAVQMEYFIKDDLSILSGITYTSKGIQLNYANTFYDFRLTGDVLFEKYKLKIRNDYLTVPFLMRKYILKQKNFFITGGAYLGYLIASEFDMFSHKAFSNETGSLGSSSFWANSEDSTLEDITNEFDYGFSVGTGYAHDLSRNFIFNAELLLNVGLRKIDSKYNNEYTVTPMPSDSNPDAIAVRATNYYGLNSNATNINMLITIGVGYRI
jgi:hypothetical protein